MILNFFKSKKNHQIKITECFICCSEHGKSDEEILLDSHRHQKSRQIQSNYL